MGFVDNQTLCLDTSILIAFLRGQEPAATSVVHAVQNYQCCVTAITSYELLFGVRRSSKEIGENALLGLWKSGRSIINRRKWLLNSTQT